MSHMRDRPITTEKFIDGVMARIDAHCVKHGIRASRFGRNVCNTQELVTRLKQGQVRLSTVKVIEQYLDTHK